MLQKLKKTINKLALRLMPVSATKYILFESIPDVSDNTKAVFDEMIRRGLHNKYKMVWRVNKENEPREKIKNVSYINWKKHPLKWRLYLAGAKAMICCNGFLLPVKKKQTSFYLSHGTTYKSVKSYYNIPHEIHYALAASEGVKHFLVDEFRYKEDQIFCLGYPRNDVLTQPTVDLKPYFKTGYKKIIAWYPTFRQHSIGLKTASQNALPIIHDAKKAKELNEYAKEQGVLIVMKPHFAQDISYIKDLGLSNICFIDDHFFVEKGITSYQFIAACDGLVSDYSSIYFDFTLCDKPVAAIWEDIEDYKQNPGLIDNYEYYMKGAEKIYTLDDFKQFLSNVSNDVDVLKTERNEIKELANYACDGKNSARVVDFIIEKAGL